MLMVRMTGNAGILFAKRHGFGAMPQTGLLRKTIHGIKHGSI
jgi:hypothetical protein